MSVYSEEGGNGSSRIDSRSTPVGPIVEGPLPGSGIPRKFRNNPHLVVLNNPGSPLAERYRSLRLRLELGTPDNPRPPHVTVITSAVPDEGKTTTATNLALAYAEDRKCRTLLIDADLRLPTVTRHIVPEPLLGFREVLAGEVPLSHALIQMTDSALFVLPSGAPSPTTLELRQSEAFGSLIDELRRRFDRVVIDVPPTVPFTDAAVLASHADGALLVVRAGTTTRPLIRRAWESLHGANALGVVLNDVTITAVDRYYYGYDDYRPERYADGRGNGGEARGEPPGRTRNPASECGG